jgi:hypothetical protein
MTVRKERFYTIVVHRSRKRARVCEKGNPYLLGDVERRVYAQVHMRISRQRKNVREREMKRIRVRKFPERVTASEQFIRNERNFHYLAEWPNSGVDEGSVIIIRP